MQALRLQAVAAILMMLCSASPNAAERSHAARAEFQRQHPCPATGEARGACPGYVVDHVIPLCAGGPDAAINMQWQAVEDAKAKDREERKLCTMHRQ